MPGAVISGKRGPLGFDQIRFGIARQQREPTHENNDYHSHDRAWNPFGREMIKGSGL